MERIKKVFYFFNRLLSLLGIQYFVYAVIGHAVTDSCFLGGILDLLHRLTAKGEIEETRLFFQRNAQRVRENLDLLADEKSKTVYTSILQYRSTKHRKYINPYKEKAAKQYLWDSLPVGDNECIVDCGAFCGENSLAFQKYLQKRGKAPPQVIAIEPDAKNYREMQKRLKKIQNKAVCSYCCGVWAEKAQMPFYGSNLSSSRVAREGNCTIAVDTIDNLVKGSGLHPTYIKMDVEGSEPQALTGAQETIAKYHPKLAVCIYHSDADMLDLIPYIHENYPFYRLYVRHYSTFFGETVLYCIP